MSSHRVLHLDDAQSVSVLDGTLDWIPLRRRLGVRAFGTNAYRADAGRDVVEAHDESGGHEEMYVVLRGRATFTVDGETFDAPAGTVVFLPEPGAQRYARAEEDGTLVLAVGGWPDRAFEPSPWEPLFLAHEARARGDHAEVVATIEREATPQQLDTAAAQYTLARHRFELGETDRAREHLARAVELDADRVADWASDSPLRDLL